MYYYNNELPPQQGWICPKCGRVNAPWMPTCDCVSNQTSGTPYLVKTSSISRDSHEIATDEPQIDDFFREPTDEERKAVAEYIESISIPTGVNVFDLMDEPQMEREGE